MTDKPTQVGGLLPRLSSGVIRERLLASGINPAEITPNAVNVAAIMHDLDRATAQANVQALEARLVALEKDAARYRWLRDGSGIAPKFDYPVAKLRREGTTLFTTALDDAIDEAMKFYAAIDAALLESKP